MSITTVAREAGISAASIHNTYPDLAQDIRRRGDRAPGSRTDGMRREVQRLTGRVRSLRQALKRARSDLVQIASEHARLLTEQALLKGKRNSHNVSDLASLDPPLAG
jgi:hypothetical protein